MNLDRIHVDRRRFLVLGGATAFTAACSPSNDEAGVAASDDAASTTDPSALRSSGAPPTSATPTSTTDAATTRVSDPIETTTPSTNTTTTTTTTSTDGGLLAFTAADFDALGVCALMAETTAGPFPTPEQLERSDVTEGYPGHPTRLGLRVVDAACAPVAGAIVEIWHADATGDSSASGDGGGGKDEGEGSTFLRGYQVAGDDGIVEFHTVYPGWYRGRAVHIHLRVHVDGDTVLTSQLFFDDGYTERVCAEAPYAGFGSADTPNARDGIAGPAIATGGLLTLSAGVTAGGEGTVALTNLGVSA